MSESILLVIALTPGIIGIAIGKLLNGDTSAEPLNKGIVKYFLYSSTSMLLAELFTTAHPLTKALNKSTNFTLLDIEIPTLIAICIAFVWKLFLKKFIIWIINKLLPFCKQNAISLPSAPLENLLLDGESHFLEIYLADGKIITGELKEYNYTDNTITLRPLPSWINDSDVARYEKDSVIMLSSGMIIKEFDYQYVSESKN